MTERFYHPQEPAAGGAGPQSSGRLQEFRRRAEQYSQVARDAIARVRALGATERQLEELENASGQ